ncbi:hypothetical protein F5Y16DRAFT_98972 [Xylariaceae sp. FL0255]|nr:hypothetical protein F5Y16DRAFT_98972 [Xylariaceae sp. FL0255]
MKSLAAILSMLMAIVSMVSALPADSRSQQAPRFPVTPRQANSTAVALGNNATGIALGNGGNNAGSLNNGNGQVSGESIAQIIEEEELEEEEEQLLASGIVDIA